MAAKPLQNSTFVWEGTDRKGAKVKGEISAQDPALAKAQLRKQGINPLKVKKKAISLFSGKGTKIIAIAITDGFSFSAYIESALLH